MTVYSNACTTHVFLFQYQLVFLGANCGRAIKATFIFPGDVVKIFLRVLSQTDGYVLTSLDHERF